MVNDQAHPVAYAGRDLLCACPSSVPLYIKKLIGYFCNYSTVLVVVYSDTVFSLLLLQSLKSFERSKHRFH